MKTIILATVAALGISVAAHAAEKEATMAQFTLTSPSFRNNQPIPVKHSCEGIDASPALKWESVPSATKSFAVITDDPDAPGGTFVHWIIYNIAASVQALPEGLARMVSIRWDITEGSSANFGAARQGSNSFGRVGYGGPCPPKGHGVHHYHFKLYALDTELNLAPRVTKSQLEAAMKGHVLGQAELVGTYRRE